MRMWMVDPKILCQKHLLGEHLELHMFVGSLEKHMSMEGYIAHNLLEVTSIEKRHEVLIQEMTFRGWSHKSPLVFSLPSVYDKYKNFYIDKKKSLDDLLSRCSQCRHNFDKLLRG